jgi:hypothetical protein
MAAQRTGGAMARLLPHGPPHAQCSVDCGCHAATVHFGHDTRPGTSVARAPLPLRCEPVSSQLAGSLSLLRLHMRWCSHLSAMLRGTLRPGAPAARARATSATSTRVGHPQAPGRPVIARARRRRGCRRVAC